MQVRPRLKFDRQFGIAIHSKEYWDGMDDLIKEFRAKHPDAQHGIAPVALVEFDIRYKDGEFAKNIPHLANHLAKVAGYLGRIADWGDHKERMDGLVADFARRGAADGVITLVMVAHALSLDASSAMGRVLQTATPPSAENGWIRLHFTTTVVYRRNAQSLQYLANKFLEVAHVAGMMGRTAVEGGEQSWVTLNELRDYFGEETMAEGIGILVDACRFLGINIADAVRHRWG